MDMKVELKNLSLIICPILLVLCMVLPAEALIDLDSRDTGDPTDNDEVYHAGQLIEIIATDSEGQAGLRSAILITSKTTGYNFGPESLVDEDDGSYTFSWDTTNLKESSDYIVKVDLGLSEATLMITIDNTSPTDSRIVINNGEPFTVNPSVRLNLYAEGASEMYISGDVIDDANTFAWIPYAESIQVRLTGEHEAKSVKVQFRDEARNLSGTATATITFEQALISSHDADFTDDDDGVYHAGQMIQLAVAVAQGATSLDGTIQIKSPSAGYDSGTQKLNDIGGGSYAYLWNTTGLPEASDYKASAILTSPTGVTINPRPLIITLDNDPPTDVNITINDDEPTTSHLSVSLTLSARGAVEMFIDGDVVDDTNTFEWIPYSESLLVNLTAKDGEKEVSVRFRDAARNESWAATDTITLDRSEPKAIRLLIEDDKSHTGARTVTLTLEAENATEMFISGDVVNDSTTFNWIPYAPTQKVTLQKGDGEKSVSAKFRNDIKLESGSVEDSIILDSTPPVISIVQSQDLGNPADNDNHYHSSQKIKIIVKTSEIESGLTGNIQIKSSSQSYDSGIQQLYDEEDGDYSYLWDTTGLLEAKDYQVEVKLTDILNREVKDTSLTIILDNTPPQNGKIVINSGQAKTDSRSVSLTISADEAEAMYIEGDIVPDSNTFQWISYTTELVANLTDGDGEKKVVAKFRDAALNENESQATIILDRFLPKAAQILIADGKSHTASRAVNLTFSAENAVEMYLKGDVVDNKVTFEWIPFASQQKVTLTRGDGEKRVVAIFRNLARIESEPVEASIILDSEPPVISLIESQDAANPEDNDNYYHAGQSIIFKVTTEDNESGLNGNIRIKSKNVNYDSGLQTLTDEGDGSYSYLWDTTGLKESRDYIVEATLIDQLKREVTTAPITLIIDNTPPTGKIILNDNAARTISRSVTLRTLASNAVEMYISGDIVDDTNTFEWIPYASEIVLNLTDGAGEKVVSAKLKDKAGNESEEIKSTIIFIATRPKISRVDSWDESDTSDNDEYYHAGQRIKIAIWSDKDTAWFLGSFRIKSSVNNYNSGNLKALDEGDGRYTYLWDTTDLPDGEYAVEAVLSDGVAKKAFNRSLVITIDNTSPDIPSVEIDVPKVQISGEKVRTASTSVGLSLSGEADVKEIYLDGDIIDDANSFEWIPYPPLPLQGGETEKLTINLTPEDGEKQVLVKVRDAALNESDAAVKTITLDTTGPSGSVLINEGAEYTMDSLVSIEIESLDAAEMYLSGDIEADNNFQWVPYAPSTTTRLTEDDGAKTVKVSFRDDLGNIGAEFEDTITLDTSPPKIKAVTSQNIANSEDNDGRYRISDTIKITPEVEGEEPDLKGSLRITSETTGYDSGSQRLTAEGENGILSFLWETNRFHAAEDYKVEIRLQDAAGNETVDSSLILALVSASAQESVTINNGDEYTELASVGLKIFSDNAVEMLIEGDVKDDSNTFEWIDYASSLEVKLTQGDGEKTVKVTFRDALQRESGPVEDTITLDTEAPEILVVKSQDAADEMDNDGRYHAGETVKFIVETAAAETGLKGSIRIHSSKVSYDSGAQKLQDDGAGEYSYLWETTGLKESDDYVVEAILTDLASHQTTDDALAITIDNTPPTSETLVINTATGDSIGVEQPVSLTETKTRSLKLIISAEDSVQMWIEGDVVDDTNTFEWIPYSTELVVNLTPGDGEKTIKIRHKDIADNESITAEATILLNESPPGIESVDSVDKDNPADDDEIYHAGQPIVILIESADAETGLEAMVQITSEANAYDSTLKRANDDGEGAYSYLWDTSGLKSASDYLVRVILQDSLGQKAVDESLTITIDNEPPSNYELRITNYEDGITNSGSIILEISAEDALEMFIEGDIVEDDTTFKWIPFASLEGSPFLKNKEVELTEGDGEKTIKVKFRDEALNESPAAEVSIALDTTPPTNAQMVINEGETETDSRAVILHLLAEDATEMYIDGDVAESDNSFKWLPYKSLKEVELTAGDGVKLVGIKYRDEVGNESERIEASIILDQPGPTSPSIIIDNGEAYTSSPKINLKLSADGATEMYIDGDVVVDSVTFQWIPYQAELQVNLINSDGEKVARARFRNGAGNESEQVETSVILDQTPPVIESVESYDANNTSDDDGIYHPGQIVLIKAIANESETGLDGSIRIRSSAVKYDSGVQKLNDGGDGSYTYLWQTVGLQDAEDYTVEITLKDAVEFDVVDNSLVITIDSTAPQNSEFGIRNSEFEKGETGITSTRSIILETSTEDAVEMFIAGDVIDDTNTFQWIPFASEIVVNLAGNDGEKNIKVKFRDAAMNETENAEVQVTLELSKPRLLPDANLIQPDGLETAYLVLFFDELIGNVSKEDFYVNLQNPNKLKEHLELDTSEVEPMVDENRVVIRLTEEQMDILKSWDVKDTNGKIPDEIWVQIPENSVFDLVGNGNLSDNGKPSIARFTRPTFLQQAALAPLEFSPNGDGVKDEATILYALNRDSEVTVKVEDWRKHLIRKWERTLQLQDITHELKWGGKKEDGSDCPDGVYTIIIESVEPLTGASVIAKTFSVILDTTPPQIIDKKPLPGGQIASETEIAIEVVDKSENQAASGIDEQNVYLIFDNNPEQTFPLTHSPSVDGKEKGEGKYVLFPGQFILESRKHIVTFHVADKAGNYTEEIAEYTVATTGASPLLQLMNYPNPFKPGGSTTIRYVLNDAVKSAVMCIYDAGGNLVLLKEMQAGDELLQPGEHRILWDGTDLFGEVLARGVYFCEFRVVTKNKGDTTKKLHKIAVW